MTFPEHWWLLALAVVGQTAFFARLAFSWPRGGRSGGRQGGGGRIPAWAPACLVLGAACGLVYAWLLRDAVLAAGQAGILLLAWVGGRDADC